MRVGLSLVSVSIPRPDLSTKDSWQSWGPLVVQPHRTPVLGGRGGRHRRAVSKAVRAPGPDFPPLSHRSTGRNPWPLEPSAAGPA